MYGREEKRKMKNFAKKIELEKVEGIGRKATIEEATGKENFDMANATLTAWSHDTGDMTVYPTDDPCYGCYDKTEFTITWSDGTTYEGRYDLHAQEHGNIGKSIMNFFRYYLKNGTEAQRKEVLDYVEKYEIWE